MGSIVGISCLMRLLRCSIVRTRKRRRRFTCVLFHRSRPAASRSRMSCCLLCSWVTTEHQQINTFRSFKRRRMTANRAARCLARSQETRVWAAWHRWLAWKSRVIIMEARCLRRHTSTAFASTMRKNPVITIAQQATRASLRTRSAVFSRAQHSSADLTSLQGEHVRFNAIHELMYRVRTSSVCVDAAETPSAEAFLLGRHGI